MFQNCEVYEDEQPPQAVLKMRKKQALSQVCYKYCSSSCLPSIFEELVKKTRDDVFVCGNNSVSDGHFHQFLPN